MSNYIGGFLMFAGLIGVAGALLALALAIGGFGSCVTLLWVSALAGWLGAECIERAEKRGRK